MKKLNLKVDRFIQGQFELSELNLLLVFQVNCPGCFIYALPLAVQLHQIFANRVNICGLSTAFEDFSLNTAENTRLLLEKGEFVGVTKQHFQNQGLHQFDLNLPFPVAFDRLGAGSELFDDEDVELLCHLNSKSQMLDSDTIAKTRVRVKKYLQQQQLAPYTFTVNQLQGTPSWILFDGEYNILAQWFGHQSEAKVVSMIDGFLQKLHDADHLVS